MVHLQQTIFHLHGVAYHLYAKDTQAYLAFSPRNESEDLKKLELCLQDVRLWTVSSYIKLKDSKTDFTILGSAHNLKGIETTHIKIGDELVPPSVSVKHIRATLNQQLKMD